MTNFGFWQKLKRPIFCLAPMADVTDCAFRQIIAKYSATEAQRDFGRVFWTEFVSADGLAHPEARKKLLLDLKYGETERPIVAQIFGSNPDNIREAVKLCRELGFDGIDINMGCPDRSIEKQGAGAGMIRNPEKAKEIIRAAREGAGDLPVSVKTRLGYNKVEIETWIKTLLEEKLPVLTVHLRTRKEMSLVPAHWDLMPKIVELKNTISPETIILGNGDAADLNDAEQKIKEFGSDGVMLGRAVFGNPFLFAKQKRPELVEGPFHATRGEIPVPSISEKLTVMIEHTRLFEELIGPSKNFAIMKKHYKAYVNGFDGAKELRMKLMDAENASEVEKITNEFLLTITS